jgi:hypothetical protein
VLTGQCVELGAEGLPLAPLVDVLRALARETPAGELVEVLGPAGPGLARLLPELGPGSAALAAGEGLQAGQLLELVLLPKLARRTRPGPARRASATPGAVHRSSTGSRIRRPIGKVSVTRGDA